jgi:hypothetical protein
MELVQELAEVGDADVDVPVLPCRTLCPRRTISTYDHACRLTCMTPRAPTLERTSCWKPDSCQASAFTRLGLRP